jgi:hypothetical protein
MSETNTTPAPTAPATQANTPFWLDKSFLSLVLVPVIAFLSDKIGYPLDAHEIIAFGLTVATFIIGNKWKSKKVLEAEIKRDTEVKLAALNVAANKSPEDAAKALESIK